MLNDEYEIVCYSTVYKKQLHTVYADLLNSHNPLPRLSLSNGEGLAELHNTSTLIHTHTHIDTYPYIHTPDDVLLPCVV